MPSPFETQFAANLSPLYDQFGVGASYSSPGGTVVTTGDDGHQLVIRVQRGDARPADASGRTSELQSGDVMVRQSQLAKPVKGGRFTIENVEVWTIENTPTLKNGEFICTCVRGGVERLMDRREKANA